MLRKFTQRFRRNNRPLIFLAIKLIIGLALLAGAAGDRPGAVRAQGEVDPFPGQLIQAGAETDLTPGFELIYLAHNRLLGWEPGSGRYRLWHFDPAFGGQITTFPEQRLAEGVLPDSGPRRKLTFLGDSRLLTWKSDTGQYKIQQYGLARTQTADRLSLQTTVEGTLPPTESERRLIYLGHQRLLDWEPASGRYQIWQYDPANAEPNAPFPGTLIVEGTWPEIRTGHELVYLGYRRLLDWEPETGRYRIWRYDPMVTGSGNPLVGKPVVTGSWTTIGPGHQLLSLGNNHLLAWEPAKGQYRLWRFELTAIGVLAVEDIGDKLAGQSISGVTVVTHGRQLNDSDGDSMLALAQDIHDRAGGWLIDYDVDGNGNDFFESCTNDCQAPAPGQKGTHEVVLLFDWAAGSNEASTGWGEAAGDALFNLLADINLLDPAAGDNPPYHFIAHSFGTAVTGELGERLARFNVPVDQITYLDAHDFDEGFFFDGAQRLFDLGQPAGYGASVWNNVTFADVYYQTRGQAGLIDAVPNGRPIPGAYSRYLLEELPNPLGYPATDFSGDHGYVWRCFYRATVSGSNPSGCLPPLVLPNFAQTGYAFSRLEQTSARPGPNFYTDQAHTFSSPQIVDTMSGLPNLAGLAELGLTEPQIVQGRWIPAWLPARIVNGDFEHYNTQEYNPGPLICNVTQNTCPQPGWNYHGGGGEGHVAQTAGNAYLVLDWGNTFQSHNRLYVPASATALLFDLRRQDGPSGAPDTFEVQLGDQTLASYPLAEGDEEPDFVPRTIPLPDSVLGQVTTLTFRFTTPIELFDGSTVWVDNVHFEAPAPGPDSRTLYLPLILR